MERLFDLASRQALDRPGSVMLASKINGAWQTISCKEAMKQAETFANGLLSLSIKNEILDPELQEKIAMISPNRPEWVIADLGVQLTGAILTPIYPTINPNELAFIMNQAQIRILIVANKEMYDRFQPAFAEIPTLQHIISFEETEGATNWKDLPSDSNLELKRKAEIAISKSSFFIGKFLMRNK